MHIAYLARAENELLASPLEDKLRFVCRLNQSQSVSAPRQSRRIREPSDRTLTALVSSPGRARFRSPTALRRSETIDTIANRGRTPQLGGFDRAGRGQRCRQDTAHDRLFGERTSIQGVNPRGGEAISSRMAGAPAQEEIDEPTGKFLRPRSDI